MRLPNFCLALLVAVFAVAGLSAGTEKKQCPKIYIGEHAVTASNSGIVMQTPSGPVRLRTVHSDENGLYIFEKDLASVEKPLKTKRYICPFCVLTRYFYSDIALNYHITTRHGRGR